MDVNAPQESDSKLLRDLPGMTKDSRTSERKEASPNNLLLRMVSWVCADCREYMLRVRL